MRLSPLLTPTETHYFDAGRRTTSTHYFGAGPDVVDLPIPPHTHRTSLVRAMWRIATASAAVLELPEPLWARFLPRTVCLAMSWTLSGLLRGRWRRARTYAIENNDPVSALIGSRVPPDPVAKALRMGIGLLVRLMYEKIAFGSDAAAAAYRSLPGVARIEHRVFTELPARPGRPASRPPLQRSAVFVGELAPRKGLSILLDAWRYVEARFPDAQLHVIGSGPLYRAATDWAGTRPTARTLHGQLPQRDVIELLPGFTVLVAPSIRWGRWREQIGLPITEALQSGLTVVTTTETGLAPWLREHGHHVLTTPLTAEALAEALSSALDDPLPRQRVLDSLPAVSTRVESDRWLHS
ncbi:glycosyltransferase [Geodermatophilus sp. CPCC 205761]|uniref:glycosyltransferase n=1 Tax=Geodermatophilus sp. CPCC 205761 TaxID=2936597 RepID=UPI003EEDA5BE